MAARNHSKMRSRHCQELLTTELILQFPDFSGPFIIVTEASCDTAGCILNQGEIGKDLPIGFASTNFNKAYRKYKYDRPADVQVVKQFRPYVLGRHFKIVTDHKPQKCVFNVKYPNSRLLRWRLKLEEYHFTIYYPFGKTTSHADFLSHIH
jgi:hypothetical protein